MNTNYKCSDDQNNVPVVHKTTMSESQDNVSKPYRVTLSVTVLVDVDVQAENKAMAEGKVLDWNPANNCGHARVGSYWWFDDDGNEHEGYDEGDLFWEIVAEAENHEILEVVELGDGDSAEMPEELTT